MESVTHNGHEIGYIERATSGWIVVSRVDNERLSTQDKSAGIAWLRQLWSAYFAPRR